MSGTAEAQRRALAFLASHGDALARRRAEALCGGDPQPALALLDAAAAPAADADRDAGAWVRTLEICDELRALRSPPARRAFEALGSLQGADGAFAEPSLPLDRRLRRTGEIGSLLARSPYGRPESLEAAGDFLARHFTPERVQGFQLENIAAYARYFANALHEAGDAVLQWCGRELERGFRTRRFDALETVGVLVACDAHGLPGASLEREELVLGLLSQQAPDGSFGSDVAPEARVEPTLHGLRALVFLGGGAARRGALDSGARAR